MRREKLLTLPLIVTALCSLVGAQDYKINVQPDGGEAVVVDVSIGDGIAVTKVGNATELFDLKQQRWQNDDTKKWVSLPECEAWAKQLAEKTRKKPDSLPEKIRPFILWSCDPTFDVETVGDTITMTSGQIDYKIVGEKSDSDLTPYFRYARLNAFKKAMTEGKLPPFAELRVLDELERRRLIPRTMDIQIPGVPEAPSFTMTISGGE